MICRFANRKLPPHSTCHRSWQLPVSRCLGKTAWKFHKCCTACPLGLPNSPNSLPKPGSANCCQVIWILSEIFWHTYSDIFWSYSAGIGVLRSKPEQILSTIVYVRITACHTERERAGQTTVFRQAAIGPSSPSTTTRSPSSKKKYISHITFPCLNLG